jgi:hypothetical protein
MITGKRLVSELFMLVGVQLGNRLYRPGATDEE